MGAYKSKTRQNVVVVQVILNITVDTMSSKWNNKSLSVNIVSGLSTGELLDFRRANISRVKGTRSIPIEIQLEDKESDFISIIACEEIAGTSTTATLKLNEHIPDTLLSFLRSKHTEDEFEEDEDGLNDLLIKASSKKGTIELQDSSSKRPFAKENEALTCKHACKDKTRCRHLCCREGLAPRPLKKPKLNVTDRNKFSEPTKKTTKANISGYDLLQKLHSNSVESMTVNPDFADVINNDKGGTSSNTSSFELVNDSSDFDVISMLRRNFKKSSQKNQSKQSDTIMENSSQPSEESHDVIEYTGQTSYYLEHSGKLTAPVFVSSGDTTSRSSITGDKGTDDGFNISSTELDDNVDPIFGSDVEIV